MVLTIVKPAVPFHWHETVAVPFMHWFEFCIGAQEVKRDRVIKSGYLHSILRSFYVHPPIPRVCAGMKVTIVDQTLHRETKRTACPDQRVFDVSGVLALPHPNPLFEQSIAKRKSPNWHCAFQPETLNVEVAFWFDGATRPTICREPVVGAVVTGGLLQLSN